MSIRDSDTFTAKNEEQKDDDQHDPETAAGSPLAVSIITPAAAKNKKQQDQYQ